MTKKANNIGQFSKSTMEVTETKTERSVKINIPKNEEKNVTAALLKINHQKGLYKEFFTLNQEFIKYVMSINLVGKEWAVFMWFLSRMDYGNKILINQEIIMKECNVSQSQASKSLAKLRKNKIILETKYNTAKYEVSFNYDILNPTAGFKGKATAESIEYHKQLIKQEIPYQRHYNIEGNIDLINGESGEVFSTIECLPNEKEKNLKINKIRTIEIEQEKNIEREYQEKIELEIAKEKHEELRLEMIRMESIIYK